MCFLECFWVFFGVWEREKMLRAARQKANFRKMCLLPIWGMLGAIYSPECENRGGSHCKAAGLNPPLIWLISTPLDRSSFSVFKKVWNSKIQQSDQKLWLSEVCKRGFHSFLDISTFLTPILTHE